MSLDSELSKEEKFKGNLDGMRLKSDIAREFVAEFLGTFILVLFGLSVMAVIVFSGMKEVSAVVAPLGWGFSLLIAISVTGGVSGCHANPAVTLAFASVGKLKWNKVLPYFLAQYLGAFVAAAVIYGIYYDSFAHFDGGSRQIPPNTGATAQIFATYATDHCSIGAALGDNIVSTMIFMMAVLAITDPQNMSVVKGSYALLISLSLSATVFAFQFNSGAPLNPARDLSPRIFTAMAGWGKGVFSFRDYGYFWVPIIGPHIGAILGAWLYKLGIEHHWPVESYDLGNDVEIKTNGDIKHKGDTPFIDMNRISNQDNRGYDDKF